VCKKNFVFCYFKTLWQRNSTVDIFSSFGNILRFTCICVQQEKSNDHNSYCYTGVISVLVLVRQSTIYLILQLFLKKKCDLDLQRRLDKSPFWEGI